MKKSYLPIYYPDFAEHIAVAMTLLYRKHRRGFAYRKIKLTKGKPAGSKQCEDRHAFIDPEDYDRIAAYDWQAIEGRCGNFYAGRIEGGKIIYMHRQIMLNPEGAIIDHKYRNGLNNTKANLRIVTQAQNACNSGKTASPCSSKYKGVNFSKDKNKWRAYITYKTKRRHLGYFETELEAARAYDAAAKKLHGKFACLNFDPNRDDENKPVKGVFKSICGVIMDICKLKS